MKNEIAVWLDIAEADFVDERFSKWVLASKAYNLFQNSIADLEWRSYRAQAAILNGLLTHHLDVSQGKFVDLRRIGLLLDHYDKLVLRSECLSGNIVPLQCLVKCSFYYRLADFMLYASIYQQSFNGIQLTTMALFCYGLALKWACHNAIKGAGGGLDISLLSLCAAELTVLLKMNLAVDAHLEARMRKCDKDTLLSFLRFYSSLVPSSVNNAHFGTSVATSFLETDPTDPIAFSELRLDVLPHLLANACSLRRNVHFLRRLGCIIAYCPVLNYHLMFDPLFIGLSPCSADENVFLSCSPESVSITDVKIFLIQFSSYMKLCKTPTCGDAFTSSWIFHCSPNVQQQQFWNCINTLLDGQQKSFNLSTLLFITNALEQIRLVEPFTDSSPSSSRDVSHLVETMQKLQTLAELSQNDEEKQILNWTAEKCAMVAKSAVNGTHFPRETADNKKTLFPPLNYNTQFEPIEDSVVEKMEQFFAKKLEQQQTTKANENLPAETEEEVHRMGGNRSLQQISDSTQTDEATELDASKMNKGLKELEGVHCLMSRLTLHNRSLIKLFEMGTKI